MVTLVCTHIEDGKGRNVTRKSGSEFAVIFDVTDPLNISTYLPQHKAAELVKRVHGKARPRFARVK